MSDLISIESLYIFAQVSIATLGFCGITATFVHVIADKKFVTIRTKCILFVRLILSLDDDNNLGTKDE